MAYMAFLALMTPSSSLWLVVVSQAPHRCNLVFSEGQGPWTSEVHCLCRSSGRDVGQGSDVFLSLTLKICCGVSSFQPDPHHPKGGPVKSLAAVPSTQAMLVLELGQHLCVEAVLSSSLLDSRQKSY